MNICSINKCTACQACKVVCPVNAIEFINDYYGNYIPQIDNKRCIKCNKCRTICPNEKINEKDFLPITKTYAAWTSNSTLREGAASGGVATTIQKNAFAKGVITYGVFNSFAKEYQLERIKRLEEFDNTANSKYAYSSAYEAIKDIDSHLKKGKKVIFIGVPCQVAAVRSVYGFDLDNLLLIDLVCHGMPPAKYYLDHCKIIQNEYGQSEIKYIRWRKNNIYDITLCGADGEEYTRSRYKDIYAIGFHGAAIYQQSCYSCSYARPERISDITLCDFWGLEEDLYLSKQMDKGITAVLINSKKGAKWLELYGNDLVLEERNTTEVIAHNGQLQMPSKNTRYRKQFLCKYPRLGFEKAAKKSFRGLVIRQKIYKSRIAKRMYRVIRKIIKNE